VISPIGIDVTIPCPSLCHVRALCSNGRRYWHNFFCVWQPNVCLRSG